MILLFKIWWWTLRNAVARARTRDVFRALFFAILGAVFLLLLYYGFCRLLWEVKSVPIVGSLLLMKIVSMAFLVTFFLIVFSSVLVSFSTLFFARDLSFLMMSPVAFGPLFLYKSLETTFYASWSVVLVLIPFVGAYAFVNDLGGVFFLALAGLSVPFVTSACGVGLLVSLLLVRFFPSRRVRDILLFLGIAAWCSVYVLFRWMGPEKLVRADSFDAIVQYISLLEAPLAPYWPSWWLSRALTAFVARQKEVFLTYGGLLFGAAAAMELGLYFLARHTYQEGWRTAQEADRRKTKVPLGSEWRAVPNIFPKRLRALLGKDVLLFFRDSNQWSQGLLLMSLVAVYLLSIQKLPLDTPFLKGLVSYLNMGLIGFLLAAVALRFLYPAVSLEGRSWWTLRSAPLSLWAVLWGKFLVGVAPLVLMGGVLAGVSNYFLNTKGFLAALSYAVVLCFAVVLAGLGVGFGALFPRWDVENVAQIESSPGGLLYMICAIFYIAVSMSLAAMVVRAHYMELIRSGAQGPPGLLLWTGLAFMAINVVVFFLPFVLGKKALESADL